MDTYLDPSWTTTLDLPHLDLPRNTEEENRAGETTRNKTRRTGGAAAESALRQRRLPYDALSPTRSVGAPTPHAERSKPSTDDNNDRDGATRGANNKTTPSPMRRSQGRSRGRGRGRGRGRRDSPRSIANPINDASTTPLATVDHASTTPLATVDPLFKTIENDTATCTAAARASGLCASHPTPLSIGSSR